MFVSFDEIREKEIVNTLNGESFGFAEDILFDTETQKITAVIIRGKPKFFGILGREEDISVGWDKIETIGKDIILIKTEKCGRIHNEKENFLKKFFDFFLY